MQKSKFHVLSTRPLGEALIKEAGKNDIIIDEISFISTEEFIDEPTVQKIHELSKENITAIFTSMNAASAVGKQIPGKTNWKIYCTGNTTRKIAMQIFGEKNISATADNAQQLAEKIIKNSSDEKIIFFCGDQRRNELPELLKKNKIDFEEIVVYKTRQTSHLVTKKYDGILFFSPSAVTSFFFKNKIGRQTQIFAIGTTTASSVKSFSPHKVITSKTPSKENLVAQAIQHFKG
jgi:uroporphyrinogen-III synthase